ncbi:hypothetical protein Scep_012219 [Stephania cephalantha]|uniref:Uncharacterized protein n=1 Tax=Stephania cephalantha TaxID=152367 RepID=A0AAP0JG63_9MAGN
MCRICGRTGHVTTICYYQSDYAYMGSTPQHGQHSSQISPPSQYRPPAVLVNAPNAFFPSPGSHCALPESLTDQSWYAGSGASSHVTNDPNQLFNLSFYLGDSLGGESEPREHISTILRSATEQEQGVDTWRSTMGISERPSSITFKAD